MRIQTGIILLLAGGLLFSSCKGFKFLGKKGENAWLEAVSEIENATLQYEKINLSGKAYVNAPSEGFSISLNYRIALRRDSVMVIRLTKLGIEAARVLVTQDSIYAIDRLNQQVIVCDFALAEEYTGLKADFTTLQSLILGEYDPIPELIELRGDAKANPLLVGGIAAGIDFQYSLDKELKKLLKLAVKDSSQNQESRISYSDFQEFSGQKMAKRINIAVLAPEELTVDFTHKKIELDPKHLNLKFDLPAGYEQTSCK